jgi:hypothetical protein
VAAAAELTLALLVAAEAAAAGRRPPLDADAFTALVRPARVLRRSHLSGHELQGLDLLDPCPHNGVQQLAAELLQVGGPDALRWTSAHSRPCS